MNNKYYKRSKISETKFRHLIKCFSLDLTATETAQFSSISLRSVTSIFDKFRQKIAYWCDKEELLEGIIEVDESYFGPRRLAQFNGVPKQKFYYHLKETEFGFTHRKNLYNVLLQRLREDPL